MCYKTIGIYVHQEQLYSSGVQEISNKVYSFKIPYLCTEHEIKYLTSMYMYHVYIAKFWCLRTQLVQYKERKLTE